MGAETESIDATRQNDKKWAECGGGLESNKFFNTASNRSLWLSGSIERE